MKDWISKNWYLILGYIALAALSWSGIILAIFVSAGKHMEMLDQLFYRLAYFGAFAIAAHLSFKWQREG